MARRRRKVWVPKKTIRHIVRRWLNPLTYVDQQYGSQGGFIAIQLRAKGQTHYGVHSNLRISDCTRSIDLDIDASDPQERDRSVRKLTILVDEITVLRDKLASMEFEKK